MKITVWTAYHADLRDPKLSRKPKCIFVGESDVVPRIGDYVECRDGFGGEEVKEVFFDLVDKTVEIKVVTTDPDNRYGPSLI